VRGVKVQLEAKAVLVSGVGVVPAAAVSAG
jgi:hypothetical protein